MRTRFGVWVMGLALLEFALAVSTARAQQAQLVTSGLVQPLFVTAAPGDATHIYVVQQTGQVLRFDLGTGTFDAQAFVDISGKLTSASGEQGLLGLAFDPGYATNGRFYLDYVVPGGQWGNGITHVSQFHFVTKKKRRHRGTTTTLAENILVSFDHPQTNHNGGWIGFSPRVNDDHNLYIATGDGGGGNDQGTGHIEPGGNAQNTGTLLGKILRIHVDPNTAAVSIPSNNPFFSSGTSLRQIYTFGLRNPFRDSFDRQTGDLFIADVGQNTREEVDVQAATNAGGGENYGWRLREGTIATPTGSPVVGGTVPAGNMEPILDYGRSTGGSIIGGYVYRGSAIPSLQGKYVFGDYVSDKIFTIDYSAGAASNFTDITPLLFPSGGLGNPSSFGEDANGELYICDIATGRLFKIVP